MWEKLQAQRCDSPACSTAHAAGLGLQPGRRHVLAAGGVAVGAASTATILPAEGTPFVVRATSMYLQQQEGVGRVFAGVLGAAENSLAEAWPAICGIQQILVKAGLPAILREADT